MISDFLDAVLYGSQELIADLEILNPWLAPRIRGMKYTYLDVRAHLIDGQEVIIEMQVLNVEGFERRILYNAAKTYSNQLHRKAVSRRLKSALATLINRRAVDVVRLLER